MQNVLAVEQQQLVNTLNAYHDSEGKIQHLVTMIICSKMENSGAQPETQVFMVGAIAEGDTVLNRIDCRETPGFYITTLRLINRSLFDLLPRKRQVELNFALVRNAHLPFSEWTSANLLFPKDGILSTETHGVRLESTESGKCTLYVNMKNEPFRCSNAYRVRKMMGLHINR